MLISFCDEIDVDNYTVRVRTSAKKATFLCTPTDRGPPISHENIVKNIMY